MHQASEFFPRTGNFFVKTVDMRQPFVYEIVSNTKYREGCPISFSNTINDIWNRFQAELFPTLAPDLGPLTANHQRFVAVLDRKPVETFIQTHS